MLAPRLPLTALIALCTLSMPSHASDISDLVEHVKRFGEQARMHKQVPLQPVKADAALIFIGGYADELGGYFHKVSEALPALPHTKKQVKAYYHWHGGNQSEAPLATERITRDIEAFRAQNPASPIILMGHSLGAARAVDIAHKLKAREKESPIYLISVDPVDRDTSRTRPASVSWWGNCYVINSQSQRDFVHEMSGRWKVAKGADINLAFDGKLSDERGYPFIHDNAWSLINSRSTHPRSLREELVRVYTRDLEDTSKAK